MNGDFHTAVDPEKSPDSAIEVLPLLCALCIKMLQYPRAEEAEAIADVIEFAGQQPFPVPFAEDLSHIHDAFGDGAWADPEERMAEYTRLFISDIPRPCCPPLESFYTDHVLRGQAFYDIQEIFGEWGREAQEFPADHLLSELGFLIFLTQDSAPGKRKALQDFSHQHLAWVRQWIQDVHESAHWSYYAAVATFTGDVLTMVGS